MSINAVQNLYLQYQINSGKKEETENNETKNDVNDFNAEYKNVSPDDVFKHMSANSIQVDVKKTKTVQVSNYVDKESAKRISDSMKEFENQFNKNVLNIKNEFNNEISDKVVEKLALSMF